ncbi:MAG TPA: hypothetical protein VNT53_01115 [Pseudolysinimonas sp.]|nr:hypothetical protein [Pseudolysinimonas sp.]
MPAPSPRALALGFAGLGLIGALAGCAASSTPADSASTGSTPTNAGSGTTADASTSGSYTDGTYDADGSYTAPSGTESVHVELTLKDGVVTALTVEGGATSGTQKGFQDKFESGINAEVVGKNIDDLNVSRVAGSSLTSTGFNSAIDAIKTEASA